MKNSIIYGLSLILLVALVSSTIFVQVNARESVSVPKLVNDVTIDGKWTIADEWADAYEESINFFKGPGTAYLKLKHDSGSLYILIDYVSDMSIEEGDTGFVGIDTNNDGGSLPQEDDFIAMIRWGDPNSFFSGVIWGKGDKNLEEIQDWQGLTSEIQSASTLSGENNPYSDTPHMTYEFKIQKSMFQSTKIGLLTAAFHHEGSDDEKIGVIPFGDVNIVNNWVELEFSDQTLEEVTKPTPISSPTPTSTPTPTPTPTLIETSKQIETVITTETQGMQISGGYLTLIGIVVVVVIIVAALMLRRKK